MKSDKKLEFRVIEYSTFRNEVVIKITKQEYRNREFYPKNKENDHVFICSNGFTLSSSLHPEYKSYDKICFVCGIERTKDKTNFSMSTKDFKMFFKAVKEYNEKR